MPLQTATEDLSVQIARLRQFLRWLIPIAFGFTGVYGIAFALLRVPAIAVVGGLCLIFGFTLLCADALARRRRLGAAVNTTCASLLLLSISGALAFPAIADVLTIIALVAVVVALPYVSGRDLFRLMIATLITVVVVTLLGEFVQLLPPLPAQLTSLIAISATTATAALLVLLLWQFSKRLHEMLARTREANTALQAAQAGLETQVMARTAALQTALDEVELRAAEQKRLLEENTQQRQTIRDLSVPVLPITADTLIMPLVGTLDHERLQQMQAQALRAIEHTAARRLLLDITGVSLIDSTIAEGLVAVVHAARLLGAEAWLVGVRPDVAQAIVGLGLDLRMIRTHSDLRSALESATRAASHTSRPRRAA
jgi:rsbT co-antagonist protein RsbR